MGMSTCCCYDSWFKDWQNHFLRTKLEKDLFLDLFPHIIIIKSILIALTGILTHTVLGHAYQRFLRPWSRILKQFILIGRKKSVKKTVHEK